MTTDRKTNVEQCARECEADMMTALSRLFGEAYLRGVAQGRAERAPDHAHEPGPGSTCDKQPAPDELVERLGELSWEAERKNLGPGFGPWTSLQQDVCENKRCGIRAILSELAKMPVELPTADEIARAWNHEPSRVAPKVNVLGLFRSRLGPVLAAKDAELQRLFERIAEIENRPDAVDVLRRVRERIDARAWSEITGEWALEQIDAEIASITDPSKPTKPLHKQMYALLKDWRALREHLGDNDFTDGVKQCIEMLDKELAQP